jgi:hypothetical protein
VPIGARDDVRMSKVISRPIDPRDQGREVWRPTYRVYFWRPVSPTGWGSREFEVSGGDIVAILDWAERHADGGETFTVFVVVDEGDRLGLVRLAGVDPTRTSDT